MVKQFMPKAGEAILAVFSKLGGNMNNVLGSRSNITFLGKGKNTEAFLDSNINIDAIGVLGKDKILKELESSIKRHGIEVVTLPPMMLELFNFEQLDSLKVFITGGSSPSLEAQRGVFNQCHLINAYGPTEATVSATAHSFEMDSLATNIGRPLNNVKVYVLSESKQPAPIGTPGELYIGGAGLARGYLNRTDLTTERFIDNPFATAADTEKGYN